MRRSPEGEVNPTRERTSKTDLAFLTARRIFSLVPP